MIIGINGTESPMIGHAVGVEPQHHLGSMGGLRVGMNDVDAMAPQLAWMRSDTNRSSFLNPMLTWLRA